MRTQSKTRRPAVSLRKLPLGIAAISVGKEQGARQGSFGLFSPFRPHSASAKSASLLATNCVACDLLYAVGFWLLFFFSSGAVVTRPPIYMNDTKMKWRCCDETY